MKKTLLRYWMKREDKRGFTFEKLDQMTVSKGLTSRFEAKTCQIFLCVFTTSVLYSKNVIYS